VEFCGIYGTAKRDIYCYAYAVLILSGYRLDWYGLLSDSRKVGEGTMSNRHIDS
jgi:hypothetical protein